jgi:hypothetical protein
LLPLACTTLRNAGYTIATLSTDAGTRAERFYRADGWTVTGKNTKGELIFEKRLRSEAAGGIAPRARSRLDCYIHFREVRMDRTVDVTIPVEPEAAAALADARNREAVGRLVSRVLRPRSGPSPLAQAIAEMKADAIAAGLTDADIDAELAAYNAERRDGRTVD